MLREKNGCYQGKSVSEFIVIVESVADARTATQLAERLLEDRIEWLDRENIQYMFCWSGLEENNRQNKDYGNVNHSCWKDIETIIETSRDSLAYKPPRFLGFSKGNKPFKADGARAMKCLNLIRFYQKHRQIKAVLFIRDLDNQKERREGLEQARLEHRHREPQLEIIIGAANPKREAWVLNGFIPDCPEEERILEEIKTQLGFDPCLESHRLRSTSQQEPDRVRNPKVIVEKLTGGDLDREQDSWETTSLAILRERGLHTGLTDYLNEVEERLVPLIGSSEQSIELNK